LGSPAGFHSSLWSSIPLRVFNLRVWLLVSLTPGVCHHRFRRALRYPDGAGLPMDDDSAVTDASTVAELAGEAQLRAIIENTSSVVFLKDLEGRYVLVNRQLELDTKLSREQVLGKTDFDLFPRETAERVRADDRRVVESGEPLVVEGVTQFPSGLRTFLTTKFPIRDD